MRLRHDEALPLSDRKLCSPLVDCGRVLKADRSKLQPQQMRIFSPMHGSVPYHRVWVRGVSVNMIAWRSSPWESTTTLWIAVIIGTITNALCLFLVLAMDAFAIWFTPRVFQVRIMSCT